MSWMPSRFDKTKTVTVPADCDQAERWEAAAQFLGYRSAGFWLGEVADLHLRGLAKAGRAAPLSWLPGTFTVTTFRDHEPPPGTDVEVQGLVSGPFGVFRGNQRGAGAPGCGSFCLAHLPTRRFLATLPLRRACLVLAAELASLYIDWTQADPERVVQGAPDQQKVQALLRLFGNLTRT